MIEKHNHNDKKIYKKFNDNKQLIKKSQAKLEFHLYLSINKWFSNDKIYYKIDYVLDNFILNKLELFGWINDILGVYLDQILSNTIGILLNKLA